MEEKVRLETSPDQEMDRSGLKVSPEWLEICKQVAGTCTIETEVA